MDEHHRKALPRLLQGSTEWYTPPRFLRAVRQVLGGTIELDPASNSHANQAVQAERYYDLVQNGLIQSWQAKTLFLNPPYCKTGATSNQELWTRKLTYEYEEAGHIGEAILLVNAATETEWFQRLYHYPICFVKGRIRFTSRLQEGQTGKSSATIGSAFIYLGPRSEQFISTFSQFGAIEGNLAPAQAQRPLWDTPLPHSQLVLNTLFKLYGDWKYPRVNTVDLYTELDLEFEEIEEALQRLEAQGSVLIDRFDITANDINHSIIGNIQLAPAHTERAR